MTTFTELCDMMLHEVSDGWKDIPMTKRDIEELSPNHFKFLISLDYKGKTLETKYYNYMAIQPNTQDVLGTIVTDARSVYDSNFPEFCMNNGFDTDSIKAFKLFKDCKKQYKKLLNFLGEELFKQFMECEMDW